MATGTTSNYFLPYPLSTDPVRVSGDIEQLATKIDNDLQEIIEDKSSAMWTGGTFSNGINSPTYNDSTGKMSMSLAQDLRTTATPTFTGVNLVGGDLYLGPSRSIIFEGSSDDTFETSFVVTNPTADRTITFQNATGTVAFTSESTLASLVNIANATGALAIQIGYGATTTGTTKTIAIGGNGVSGSTTDISIGSSVSGALGTTTINSVTTSLLGNLTIATGKAYQINGVNILTSTALGSSVVSSSLTSVGTITSGTWSGSFGAVSGANLTNLTAANLTGTIPSSVLGNSSVFIGTTSVALNRSSAALALTGITSIDGSAATLTTGRTIGMTGDVTWTSGSFNGSANVTGTSTISNSAVTYAKIQNVSAQYRVLGRITTAAGVVEELTPDNMVTLINQASTAIAASEGGTGQTSYTIGDILYASSTSALSKLAGVATGNALISGGIGTAPSWGKIGLTTHVSGTLPIANGGTGITTTPPAGAVVYGNGTSFAFTSAGSAGQVLTSNGTGAPTWTALPGASTINITGDATGSGTSNITLTLSNSGVSAGTYGSATSIPVIQVDAKGRITSASSQQIDIDPMPQIFMMAGM